MEIRLSFGMLALLAGVLWGLTPRAPRASLNPVGEQAAELSALEDAFAGHRGDVVLARRLAATYLRLDQPALAIGVVRAVSPSLVVDPLLTHHLAQAYEAVGHLDDALATASVAHARCLRALGSDGAAVISGPTRFACSPRALVALEQHEAALTQMLVWGVSDPRHDPRADVARGISQRRARIASIAE
jgi:hypothetical protein